MKHIILILAIVIPTLIFSQDEPLRKVDEMPRYPGCESIDGDAEAKRLCSNQLLLEYIYNNVKYPIEAKKAGTEGTVVIQFIIDKTGQIKNEIIARDIGENCGIEALEAVKSMADNNIRWSPGIEQGNPVDVLFTLPVKFKLEGEKTKEIDTGN